MAGILSQSDSDSQSLREDNSQSDNYSDDACNSDSDDHHDSQHDDSLLYSNNEDSSSEWQSMSLKRKLPEEVQAMPEEPKAVLCFSSVY